MMKTSGTSLPVNKTQVGVVKENMQTKSMWIESMAGLEDCQVKSENKLHFHLNASLTTVSLAKALHYLNIPKEERDSFSMTDA